MEENNRVKVALQPFSDEITDDYICEFSCSKCKQIVRSSPKVQARLASGGVGHKCLNCNTYLAIIQCPNCKSNLTIDDEEWEKLVEPAGVNCPTCGVVLFREKENVCSQIVSSGILLPALCSWSKTTIEDIYISKLKRILTGEKISEITVRHHSVAVRMRSARESLDYLINNVWYCPQVISNTPDYINDPIQYKTPFHHDFHNNLFGLINNLRSALDIFTQEIMSIIKPGFIEKRIEFKYINDYVKRSGDEIINITKKYHDSESYNYLNDLRNVLQHRRIPLMVSVDSYDTNKLDAFRPKNIRSIASIRLPRNPCDPDILGNNNAYTVMLFPKIKELYNDAEQFMLAIYERIIP
ncbi:MAG: hypothetical protein ACYCYR_03205 [Desulfobulbaceae bacterium]|jgi:uncharacterized protein YbaR (Trm112 family)